MKLKGLNVILLSIVVLCAGYFLGAYIGWPNTQESLLSGDIHKAGKFKQNVSASSLKTYENNLKTDVEFRSEVAASLGFINSRASNFAVNTNLAKEACSKVEALKDYMTSMTQLSEFATNAYKSTSSALEALDQMMEGKKNVDYETLSNNATISYMMLSNGNEIAKGFVETIDNFLANNKNEDYSFLAFTRDQWASYSSLDALLNNDSQACEYWGNKGQVLDNESTKKVFESLDSQLQSSILSAAAYGLLFKHLASGNLELSAANQDELLGYVFDKERLGITNQEKLGIMNQEKLGIMNQEKLGIMNQERILGLCSSEALNLANSQEGLNLFSNSLYPLHFNNTISSQADLLQNVLFMNELAQCPAVSNTLSLF